MNKLLYDLVDIDSLYSSFNAEKSTCKVSPLSYTDEIKRRGDNRLLNIQANIEYALLRSRIFAGILEANKFLERDDQMILLEYKLCTSVRFRKHFFIMEFKQLPIDNGECNHALDLVFQSADRLSDASGKATLTLGKERNQFVWQQLHPVHGGPSGTSKIIASLVLRWLQNESSLFMRFSPA